MFARIDPEAVARQIEPALGGLIGPIVEAVAMDKAPKVPSSVSASPTACPQRRVYRPRFGTRFEPV